MAEQILSTGALARHPLSVNAHVDVVNLNADQSRIVTVEVFDWGVDQVWDKPTPVQVDPSGPIKVTPHSLQSFITLITKSTAQPDAALSHYEVRITLPNPDGMVVNCFATDNQGKVVEENSLLHKELVEISLGLSRS
jgi:hypothetical protein